MPEPNKVIEVNILKANTADRASVEDNLGFEPYVGVLAEFLSSPDTEPPLTLSIEGEWGSGKSSFMLQLEDWLKREGALTLRFNPWRHDRAESLWAAFAIQFIRKISARRNRFDIFRPLVGHFKLLWYRFNWKNGWLDAIRAGAMVLLIICISIMTPILLFTKGVTWIENFSHEITQQSFLKLSLKLLGFAGGLSASVAAIIPLWLKLVKLIANPLEIDLKAYLQAPDYESQVSFIENFHEDFKKIVKAYVGNNRVYVFIDDLDRCEVPKAADLMQALNLMLSGNSPLIFILGMDREKIAASLAVKYEKLMPYITSPSVITQAEAEDKSISLKGLEYGYDFIEKFVQIPFRVPKPRESCLEPFLYKISHPVQQKFSEPRSSFLQLRDFFFPGTKKLPSSEISPLNRPSLTSSIQEQELKKRLKRFKIRLGPESKEVTTIVRMIASTLDYNPRRLKQFINLFRMKAYIAYVTGLFDEVESSSPLTLQQLGKFTAIILRWPQLQGYLEADHHLLKDLQEFACSRYSSAHRSYSHTVKYWGSYQKLIELLCYKCPRPDTPVYSLAQLDIAKLLQVSPQVFHEDVLLLLSEVGADYTQLYDYLVNRNWKEADKETKRLMLQVRNKNDYLLTEDIENFPCLDLQTIDLLWRHYSEGKFGFSVQRSIWENAGGDYSKSLPYETYQKFGQAVGWFSPKNSTWQNWEELVYNQEESPRGHFPSYSMMMPGHFSLGTGDEIAQKSINNFLKKLSKCSSNQDLEELNNSANEFRDLLKEYFSEINSENYDSAWNRLSDKLKSLKYPRGKINFTNYFKHFSSVELSSPILIIKLDIKLETKTAEVIVPLRYITNEGETLDYKVKYCLLRDTKSKKWLIDDESLIER